MKLSKLRIVRMPGIDSPFELEAQAGLNVIEGPNGSGKSTICRAVRHLLWPREETVSPLAVESWWQDGQTTYHAVREGSAPTLWQRDSAEVPAPKLPLGHVARAYNLGLLDLVKASADATDTGLATRIRTLMAGGYDLEKIASAYFQISKRVGEHEAKAFRSSFHELKQLQAVRNDLQRQEESLETLNTELHQSVTAQSRLTFWRKAKELATSREDLVRAQNAVAAFPKNLAKVRGNEGEDLERIDADLKLTQTERDQWQADLTEAKRTIETAGLPAGPVNEMELSSWRERLRLLSEQYRAMNQASLDEEKSAAELAEVRSTLETNWAVDDMHQLTREDITETESLLRRTSASAWQCEGLARARDILRSEPPTPDPHAIKTSVSALEGWLAAGTLNFPPKLIAPLLLLILLAITGTITVTGITTIGANQLVGWLALLGGSLGALAIIWYDRNRRTGIGTLRNRAQCVHDFRSSGLTEPEAWKPTSVLARLKQLRSVLATVQVYETTEQIRTNLTAEIDRLHAKMDDLKNEKTQLGQRVSADPESGSAELLAFLQRIYEYQKKQVAHAGSVARLRQLTTQLEAGLAAANDFLVDHGCAEATDPHAAGAALADLAARSLRIREAATRQDRARRNLQRLEVKGTDLSQQRQDLFQRIGLADHDVVGMSRLQEQRVEYQEAISHRDFLQRVVAEKQTALHNQSGYDLQEEIDKLPLEVITHHIDQDEQKAEKASELQKEITRIEERIQQACRSREVANAMSALESASIALSEKREECLWRSAGKFLLSHVMESHEERSQPAVLTRARDLFATFTHHSFRLQVRQTEGRAYFAAYDTIRERGLTLSQLSDGTRAQLLLAARLAFVLEAEDGDRQGTQGPPFVRPPIFLDESLTSSDPERFQAIASSLMTIIREEGRQIFYLTTDPADVQAWQYALGQAGLEPIVSVDLRKLRQLAAANTPALISKNATSLHKQTGTNTKDEAEQDPTDESLPSLPTPGQNSADEYGTLLGVTLLDLHQPPSAVHLFHLLRDDLELLHGLLEQHVETVGQWRSFARGAANATMPPDRVRLLSARADALVAFARAWRVGRGRPVDLRALEASGSVSPKFLPDVLALTDELAGHGDALLAALRNGRIKRFVRKKIDTLQAYLLSEGYLDPQAGHDEYSVRNHVLRDVSSHLANGTLNPEAVTGLVHQWWVAAGGDV